MITTRIHRGRPRLLLTSAMYTAEAGVRCPYCREMTAEASSHFEDSNEEGKALRRVWCDSCGKQWYEIYKLIGWRP